MAGIVRPKACLHGRLLKNFYRAVCAGYLPKDWRDRPPIWVHRDEEGEWRWNKLGKWVKETCHADVLPKDSRGGHVVVIREEEWDYRCD